MFGFQNFYNSNEIQRVQNIPRLNLLNDWQDHADTDHLIIVPLIVHWITIYSLLFDQVIFGKSSCAEFMNEAYTPVIYHNK